MRIEGIVVGCIETNCWLVDDGQGGPLLVIDPGSEPKLVLEAIGGREVSSIVLTHGHFDHAGAVGDVISATGAPFAIHVDDAKNVVSSLTNGGEEFAMPVSTPAPDILLHEGDHVRAGSLDFVVIHVPGHTPGGIALYADGHLFSGDTLFSGSVGRTDLPGGDGAAIKTSIARLAALPPETQVHPGHGPQTTISRELRVNPFFPRA